MAKILILSSLPEERYGPFVDSIEDAGGSVILKELAEEDYSVFLRHITEGMGRKHSAILAFAEDPVALSISINKSRKIVAALCNSEKEMDSAIKSGADVVVVGSRLNGIDGLLGGEAGEDEVPAQRQPKPVAQKPQLQKPAAPGGFFGFKAVQQKPAQQIQKKEQRQENDQEEEEIQQGKRKKGIIGRIKDELGIVD
jgi:hypothetical protein